MADKTVGQNIKKYREARGLIQKELAEMIGRKSQTVSNWELGNRDPGADNIKRIAAALEISPSELIGHNEGVAQDDTFEIVCSDGSMLPEIKPGDRVVASRSTEPKNGDFVVAYLPGMENYSPVIRSIVIAGEKTILIPINRTYPFTPDTDFKVVGRVIQITRKL